MKPSARSFVLGATLCLGFSFPLACAQPSGPQSGTQTNWLSVCDSHNSCGIGNACLCGTCTRVVDDDPTVCDELPGATAVASDDRGAIALCGGTQPPVARMCLARCRDGACPEGSSCTAGVCKPTRETTMSVSVDTSSRYQTLVGFGAGIAYSERAIVNHPSKEQLLDAMFRDSGFSAMRLRNAYVAGEDTDLSISKEIVDAAAARLGASPLVLLSSSVPAALKENGDLFCDGNPTTCMLTRNAEGEFDYAALATHFRQSLEAYATADITVDYLSIQNDPNYLPPAGSGIETSRYLPTQGTELVDVNGTMTEIEYPGYREALDAVNTAIADLPDAPKIMGPETTGIQSSADFMSAMGTDGIDALAHHMYGLDPFDPEVDALASLAQVGRESELPLFQTEMGDEGLETAMLIQEALVDIGSSTYLQTGFVAPAGLANPDDSALIALTESGFVLQEPYHAMRHFAYFTEPGWQRVAVELDRESVRVSAWLSPDEDELTIIFVNPQSIEETVELELEEEPREIELIRTVFTGVERSAELGALAYEDRIVLPPNSIVTLDIER